MWLFVPKKAWLTKYLDHICLQSFSNYQPFNATETKTLAQRRRNKFNRQTRSNPRLFRSEPVQQVFFPKQWNEPETYLLDQNEIFWTFALVRCWRARSKASFCSKVSILIKSDDRLIYALLEATAHGATSTEILGWEKTWAASEIRGQYYKTKFCWIELQL